MKLTVFGSTGRTGRCVLTEGLVRGHDVVAFTRRPQALTDVPTLAGVIHGDGRDREAVTAAVSGADAVVAILAARSRGGPHQVAEVAHVITDAMADVGVRRLIITSAYPVVAAKPRLPMALLRFVFAGNYADARAMEQHVSASELDWTIVRLNRLTNRAPSDSVRLTPDLLDRPSAVSRADVAASLVTLAEDGAYARTAVNLAGRGKLPAHRTPDVST
ncbi:MAG: NAD(P)-binding oxidoreductase [Solirubrobacteraceae bacterium]